MSGTGWSVRTSHGRRNDLNPGGIMRRNVRNITLVGLAALVLGGVAVASSGRFDSAKDATTGAGGGFVDDATAAAATVAPATTIPAFGPGNVSLASAGGAESAAAPPAPGVAADAAPSASRQSDVDSGAKIVKTADLTVSIAKGKFTGAFAEASRIATANGGFVVSSSTSTTGFPGGPIPIDDSAASSSSESRAR